MKNKKKSSFLFFWNTLPEVVKAITGLVIAITALITLLIQIRACNPPNNNKGAIIDPNKTIEESSNNCYEFSVYYFEIMPHSLYQTLKNSIKSKEYMYWFRFKGKNECNEELRILITFESLRSEPRIDSEYNKPKNNPHHYTIKPGEIFDEKIPDPGFNFMDEIVNDKLVVMWEIFKNSDPKMSMQVGRSEIEIKPKNMFYWKILKPDGSDVNSDFLLASLASWTFVNSKSANEKIKVYSERFSEGLEGLKPTEFTKQFMAQAYNEMFFGEKPEIKISPSALRFPPTDGYQEIQNIQETLEKKAAVPIEAVLLTVALSRPQKLKKKGVNLLLFTIPDEKPDSETFSFLLAWHVVEQESWYAVDMSKPDQSFDDNLKLSTDRLNNLLKENPSIKDDISMDGVFFRKGEPIVSIDFAKAKEYFGIKNLP